MDRIDTRGLKRGEKYFIDGRRLAQFTGAERIKGASGEDYGVRFSFEYNGPGGVCRDGGLTAKIQRIIIPESNLRVDGNYVFDRTGSYTVLDMHPEEAEEEMALAS